MLLVSNYIERIVKFFVKHSTYLKRMWNIIETSMNVMKPVETGIEIKTQTLSFD